MKRNIAIIMALVMPALLVTTERGAVGAAPEALQDAPVYSYMRRPPMPQPAPMIRGSDVRAFVQTNRLSPDQEVIIETLHEEYLETLALVHEAEETTSDWLASLMPANYGVSTARDMNAMLSNLTLQQTLSSRGMVLTVENQFLDDLLTLFPEQMNDIAALRYAAAHRYLMTRHTSLPRFARMSMLTVNVFGLFDTARPTPEEREKAGALLTPFAEQAAELMHELSRESRIALNRIQIVINLVQPARAAGNEREAQRRQEEFQQLVLGGEALAVKLLNLNLTLLRELSAVLSDETAARLALVVESAMFPGVTDLHNLAAVLNDALHTADPAVRPSLEALRDRYAGELARTTAGLRSAHQRIMAQDSLRELYDEALRTMQIMPVNEPMRVFREIEAKWTAEAGAMHTELQRIRRESR